MVRQLKLELSHRQLQDIYGNDVIYTGTSPLALSAVTGATDTTWYDFTDYVSGLEGIELEFSVDYDSSNQLQEGQLLVKKGASGELVFERDAYEYLKSYLVNDVASPLNEVIVRITDIQCGQYIGFSIKARNLEWCEVNALCTYAVNLQQTDPFTTCLQRTSISDNWQGWFQDEPIGGKKHPRFSYCVEQRPNAVLIAIWVITAIIAVLYGIVYTVLLPIRFVIYALIAVINSIISVINSIITFVNTLGAGISTITPIDNPVPASPADVFEAWAILMIESGGCGREHPAPLVRDYILNVCNKCGIDVDANSADIFFAPAIKLVHSDGVERTEPNPYYNVCYFFPSVVRGVRRFRNINLISGYTLPDTTTYYQRSNAPIMNLSDFLDELKKEFNAQWKIDDTGASPKLYFKRKDWFINEAPLYNFSFGGTDREKLLQGICYKPLDVKFPASCSELYIQDPSDKCGDEAKYFYNGDRINFGFTVENPLFKGILDKKTNFSPARFNCDGSATNYLYDALQWCYNPYIVPIVGSLSTLIFNEVATAIGRYADYAVLLQTEQVTKPKLIIWDGDTDNLGDPNYLNARAIKDKINIAGSLYTIGHSGWTGTVASVGLPDINTFYPSEIYDSGGTTLGYSTIPDPTPWNVVHPPQTDVIGRISPATPPDGVYQVINIFGSAVMSAAAILVNYPMYFEPHYRNTLWDWFHWIDDPTRARLLNKEWNLKIPLCCDDITRLNLTGTINGMKVLTPVLLDTPYYNNGLITSIKVHYGIEEDNEDGSSLGQYIELKGLV